MNVISKGMLIFVSCLFIASCDVKIKSDMKFSSIFSTNKKIVMTDLSVGTHCDKSYNDKVVQTFEKRGINARYVECLWDTMNGYYYSKFSVPIQIVKDDEKPDDKYATLYFRYKNNQLNIETSPDYADFIKQGGNDIKFRNLEFEFVNDIQNTIYIQPSMSFVNDKPVANETIEVEPFAKITIKLPDVSHQILKRSNLVYPVFTIVSDENQVSGKVFENTTNDTASEENVAQKENTVSQDDNEVVDDVETDDVETDEVETDEVEVDVSVSYSVSTSETAENEKNDDIVSYNTTTAQMVDKNILADEELMKTITPEQLQDYIARGADVNAKDESGWTVLSIAAKNTSNPEVIELLLKQDVDVNDKNEYGVTALMYAAKYNENSKISEILIKYGANINDDDNDGDTALMYAAGCNDNPEVVKVILRNGADVNVKNEDGSTALTEAFGRSNNMFNVAKGWRGQNKPNQKQLNDKIIELLIENGADTDILFSKFISLENAIVIDFDPHGVFLKTQDIDRLILYTMDKNYSNKELFKSKGLMYQKVGNYTYQTVIGSQYSVPAYQATPYKFSDIDKFKVKVKSVGREKIGANYLE